MGMVSACHPFTRLSPDGLFTLNSFCILPHDLLPINIYNHSVLILLASKTDIARSGQWTCEGGYVLSVTHKYILFNLFSPNQPVFYIPSEIHPRIHLSLVPRLKSRIQPMWFVQPFFIILPFLFPNLAKIFVGY